MKKACNLVFLVSVILLMSSISSFGFPDAQKKQGTPKKAYIEVAQLNIFDDPNVDNRLAELQRRIDAGRRAGQLTTDEANKLQANLDRIKEKIAKYRADGFLTPTERSQINEMFTNMEGKIRAERTDQDVAQRDAFGRRIAEAQRRIDDGARSGQLTREEANRLHAALNRVRERDASFRADNVMTDDEKFRLTQMLNALDERIRFERNDSDVVHREAFGKRISEMKRKIEAGMRVGQLNLDEACRLNSMLLRIKERDERFRSDGVLTREERVRLNQMLIHLEERIYEERWDADVNHPLFR